MNATKLKAVVTGGAGFIGSNLVDRLVTEGYDVHIIDNLSAGKKDNVHPEATLHEADIRDLDAIKPIIAGATYVFHLAALPRVQYSIEFPKETSDVNIGGTVNVLIAAKEAGVRKVIFSTSAAVYGDQDEMPLREDFPGRPKSPYGAQKYIGEILCRQWSDVYGVPTVALRYFNVYGPRLNPAGAYALVVGIFLRQKKEGGPLTIIGDGTQTRDYVHVRDIAEANVLAATSEHVGAGEVVNVGSGTGTSVSALAALFDAPVEHIAPRLEPHDSIADSSRAKELLGWEPKVPLEQGIAELLAEWKLD